MFHGFSRSRIGFWGALHAPKKNKTRLFARGTRANSLVFRRAISHFVNYRSAADAFPMSNGFSYLIPLPPAAIEPQFEVYQNTRAFYDEVKRRQDHADHCRWYAQIAAQHRQELAQMQGELNPLRWFHHR